MKNWSKFGFTLAEVLITLGIIGVVAAMTIPVLMTNFMKNKTETQLKTFYSKINQTVKMSIADNGDPEGWVTPNKYYTYQENVKFLNTYFFPYMKTLGYEDCSGPSGPRVCINLMDGGIMSFRIDSGGGDIIYFTNINKEKVFNYYSNYGTTKIVNRPRYSFTFQFAKINNDNDRNIISQNYVEPYIYSWNGRREHLFNKGILGCYKGCSSCAYCTKVIQMNDWKIPKDYPW